MVFYQQWQLGEARYSRKQEEEEEKKRLVHSIPQTDRYEVTGEPRKGCLGRVWKLQASSVLAARGSLLFCS